jgi:hypothetical protein
MRSFILASTDSTEADERSNRTADKVAVHFEAFVDRTIYLGD